MRTCLYFLENGDGDLSPIVDQFLGGSLTSMSVNTCLDDDSHDDTKFYLSRKLAYQSFLHWHL
ncbi:hypothetical protein MITS9508_00581 [Synechococcus sp. MIT S9508]|nr:hypothetical protein MITS9508_00581 [Synechococcus sp. MIT S9508]